MTRPGPLHDGGCEAAGGDGHRLGADAEEAADEAYAVIAVTGRQLDLADVSETAAVGEGKAGGRGGAGAMVLLSDLNAGALLLQSPQFRSFLPRWSRGVFRKGREYPSSTSWRMMGGLAGQETLATTKSGASAAIISEGER